MRYGRTASLATALAALAILWQPAAPESPPQGTPMPYEGRLDPTLNWDSCPERGVEWQQMLEEGRIHFDAETGNYLMDYVSSDGAQKSWIFEPASKVQVTVTADVSYDASTGLYTYSYTVSNGAESVQRLWRFGVEHGQAEILNATAPPDDPDVDGAWRFHADFASQPVAVWTDTEYNRLGIAPGEVVRSSPSFPGFSFQSNQGPGPVRCYAQGYVPAPGPFAYGEAPADPRPTFYGDCVVGTTIGPAAQTKGTTQDPRSAGATSQGTE